MSGGADAALLAPELVREVVEENAAFARIATAHAIQQKLTELHVYYNGVGGGDASTSVVVDVPRSMTIRSATDKVGPRVDV